MRQQINLYQPELFDKKIPFSSRMVAMVLAGALLCAVLAGALGMWRSARLAAELERLQERQMAALQRLEEVQRQYPPRVPDPDLARQVDSMLEERQARLALLEMLTGSQPGNSRGFSRYLEGLAREDLSAVWLRRIRLSAGGQQLLLEGSATRAADVPLYLQRLTRQQDYAGREFEHLQISRAEDNSQVVDFLIKTTHEEKP